MIQDDESADREDDGQESKRHTSMEERVEETTATSKDTKPTHNRRKYSDQLESELEDKDDDKLHDITVTSDGSANTEEDSILDFVNSYTSSTLRDCNTVKDSPASPKGMEQTSNKRETTDQLDSEHDDRDEDTLHNLTVTSEGSAKTEDESILEVVNSYTSPLRNCNTTNIDDDEAKSKCTQQSRDGLKKDKMLQKINCDSYGSTENGALGSCPDMFAFRMVEQATSCDQESEAQEGGIQHSERQAGPNGSMHNTHKRKKKKKHLLNLKKTTAKVGIAPFGVLPPITPVSDRKLVTSVPERELVTPDTNSSNDDITDDYLPEKDFTKSTDEEVLPEPLRLCKIITKYPVSSFLVVTALHITVFAVTFGLLFTGHDVFPVVFDTLPLYIHNDARVKELAWRLKSSYDSRIYRPVHGTNIRLGYKTRLKETVEVIYENPGGGNVLNTEDLKLIRMAENYLFVYTDYQEYFCMEDAYYSCIKPLSILRFFDGTYAHVDPVFNDAEFSKVNEVIYKASIYNETKQDLLLFLGKDYSISPNNSRTSITRSFFLMGWPLGYMADGNRGKLEDLVDFLADRFKYGIEYVRDHYLVDRLDVYYLSKLLVEHDIVVQALRDMKLAIGSCVFIFVFMCLQTGSIVVTSLGLLSILSSFLLTNLIYRYVFQFIYFGFFHGIAVFLILGIGADDLFVFYDTWRLTGRNKYPSDAHRLSECFRKAAKTTFVTSCTTMAAFLVSGLSPLLPVKTFGIFAAVLVSINYIWVIVYFPSIIILHHTKIKNIWYRVHKLLLSICLSENLFRVESPSRSRVDSMSSGSTSSSSFSDTNSARILIDSQQPNSATSKSKLDDKSNVSNVPTTEEHTKEKADSNRENKTTDTPNSSNETSESGEEFHLNIGLELHENGKCTEDEHTSAGSFLNLKQIASEAKETENKKPVKKRKEFKDRNRVVMCLRNGYFFFVTLRVVKIMVPICLIGVTIFFIISATKMEPGTNQLNLFRNNHNYAVASQRHYFEFVRNFDDEYQRLYLVWGMHPADVSQCNFKSAEFCRGTPVWDDKFNMNSPEAQVAFKALCNKLENIDASTAESLRIQRDSSTGKLKISCFAKPFDDYFKEEMKVTTPYGRKYPSYLSLQLPVDDGNVTTFMAANRFVYNKYLGKEFDRNFEILVSYWLTNGYTIEATPDYFYFNQLLAEQEIAGVTKNVYYEGSGLYYGTRLRYLAIEINTTMNVYSLGYKQGMPVYQRWEDFIQNINSELPSPVNNGFQVTDNLWHWLHVQETLATSAVTGILVGLLTAWPILVIMTLNYVIGTIAVVTISLVTACVVGLIPLVGWKLGVLESINLCMVVGLSVDYIVHLAEAYRMSKSPKRLDRVREMLESIGLSVISGAVTTMGAAAFMLFAKIQFFFQFGVFIISTVGISLIFSLVGFTTFMSLFGPQGETGSVIKLVKRVYTCCAKCAKTKNDDASLESGKT